MGIIKYGIGALVLGCAVYGTCLYKDYTIDRMPYQVRNEKEQYMLFERSSGKKQPIAPGLFVGDAEHRAEAAMAELRDNYQVMWAALGKQLQQHFQPR